MRFYIGCAMLISLFLSLFIFICIDSSFVVAIKIYGFSAFAVAFTGLATYLMGDDDED